jgi:hypothetical protein
MLRHRSVNRVLGNKRNRCIFWELYETWAPLLITLYGQNAEYFNVKALIRLIGTMNLLSQLCKNVLFIDTYKSHYMFRLPLKPSSGASRVEY